MKPHRRITTLARHLGLLSTTSALVLAAAPVGANPVGEQVVSGVAGFDRSLAGSLLVGQSTQSAIINWQGFSIGAGESTRFVVPTGGATLNRVITGDPSSIYGSLSSNGTLMLINPNGILVGPSGTVDTAGLVLSTLDVSDSEFLARGDLSFKGDSPASVINFGRITSFGGGDVFMFARSVENHGSISAPGGTVGLAAGSEIILRASDSPDGRIAVRAGSGRVVNSGTIAATVAELRAAGGNHYALAVNNTGVVRATGVANRGGRVFLTANSGRISNSGAISARNHDNSGGKVRFQTRRVAASSSEPRAVAAVDISGSVAVSGTIGGQVVVEAESIRLASGARIDASGTNGGGEILVGGGFQGKNASIINASDVTVEAGARLSADSTGSGDAGRVVVWADGHTSYAGYISAQALGMAGDGGEVEVSGKDTLAFTGDVNTRAVNGSTGHLLLDPSAALISDAAPDAEPASLSTATISGLLVNNNVEISSPAISVVGPAHIVWENVAGTDGTTLTLNGAPGVPAATIVVDATVGDVIIQNFQQSRDSAYLATHQTTVNDFIKEHDAIVLDALAITIGGPTQTGRIAIGSEFGDTIIGRTVDGIPTAVSVMITSGQLDGASTQIGMDLATLAQVRGSVSRLTDNDYQLYHAVNDPNDPRYYSQVWVEHAHNGDIEVNGVAVTIASGIGQSLAEAYRKGNFVQIGHGGNANYGYDTTSTGTTVAEPVDPALDGDGNPIVPPTSVDTRVSGEVTVVTTTSYALDGDGKLVATTEVATTTHRELTDTSGYAILDADIDVTAATLNMLTGTLAGAPIPGMSGERAYVQVGHGVDNYTINRAIHQGDVSGDITIDAAAVTVGLPAAFSPPYIPTSGTNPYQLRLDEQVDAVRVGHGGHATYKGVALGAEHGDEGAVIDPVEITTGRISGVITVNAGVLSVGGIETLASAPIGTNAPVLSIVRHDQIGHGATVKVVVADDGTAPSHGAIQTNIGAIGNFLTINGSYRNVIDFNNPFYQLTNASSGTHDHDGTPVDNTLLSDPHNTNAVIYYTIEYAIADDGTVTRTIVAHTLPTNVDLYDDAGKLNTNLIAYYDSTGSQGATIVSPDGTKTAKLDGLLRSFVGTLINDRSGLPTATSYSDGQVVTDYRADANGNPIILLAMDNAKNQGSDVQPWFNQALIAKGTDYATNYRAYMPATAATSETTVYGSTTGNSVGIRSNVSDTTTTNALNSGQFSNTFVDTGEVETDTATTITGDTNDQGEAKTLYGVRVMNPDGSVSTVTAFSLTAPRNAVGGASDVAQRFVANADGYNLNPVYADGQLSERLRTHAAGSPDIVINAGATTLQQSIIAGNMVPDAVAQWQHAIVGNGNWIRSSVTKLPDAVLQGDHLVKAVEYSQFADGSPVGLLEDAAGDRNLSSRGDITVSEGFISGRILMNTAALMLTANVTTGNQSAASMDEIFVRVGAGSVYDMRMASGAPAGGGDPLRPSRGADLVIDAAHILGATVDVTSTAAVQITAAVIEGNQSGMLSNFVTASIGNGSSFFITTGDGGAGGAADGFLSDPAGDRAVASARAGDVTLNRGTIGDGLLLVDRIDTDLNGGSGPVGGVVVGGTLVNANEPGWDSWNADGDVWYSARYGRTDTPETSGKVSATEGVKAATSGAAPTIFASDVNVSAVGLVTLLSNTTHGNQGAVSTAKGLTRIGNGNIVEISTGHGGTGAEAASGGRGGDIMITQRSQARDLDGFFGDTEDVAAGERGDVHVSALLVNVLANVVTGNQGTASWNTQASTIGSGDDFKLLTGHGGAAGAGNQSGVNILHAAQGGAGGNINVLLDTAETQGDIFVTASASGSEEEGAGLVTVWSQILEGQQTLSNFNQVETVIGHTSRFHAVAGAGGAGSAFSNSANVRGGDGGSILIGAPMVNDRIDDAAEYTELGFDAEAVGPYSHLGTADIRISAGGGLVQANRTSASNLTSPAEGVSDNIFAGIGMRDRVVAVAGNGGAGGSSSTAFVDGLQPDASGGNGGDAISVSGSVRSNIIVDAAASLMITNALLGSPLGGDGGYTQVHAQVGHDQDIYTSSGLAGNGGLLTATADKGGIADARISGVAALDSTTDSNDEQTKVADLAIKIIPTTGDGDLNRGGTDNGIDISGAGADGGTINAKGAAWSVADLASVGTVTEDADWETTKEVTLANDKFILYDKAGNPEFKWDATEKVWVDNRHDELRNPTGTFVAGENLANVLGADINRDGKIDVITFRGVDVANGAASYTVGGNQTTTIDGNSVVTATTLAQGDGTHRSARVDIVDINGDGNYDRLAGRGTPTAARATNVAYVGSSNTAYRNGVLDYEVVTTRTTVTPYVAGTARTDNWSGSSAVVTAAGGFGSGANGGYSLQVETPNEGLFVSGDFSRSNGGRGGDSVISTGYTNGRIDVSTLLLTVITNIDDVPSGLGNPSGQVGLPNDRYTARLGHGGTYLADTANTAAASSWQAGADFGLATPKLDVSSLLWTGEQATRTLLAVTASANGGNAGGNAVVAVGGRAGDSLIALGSLRPVDATASVTERDELTGAINIAAEVVSVSTIVNNDLGGNIATTQIGHGDQIFANANGAKMVAIITTPALDSTMLSPWRAGSAIPGTAPAGNTGGSGMAAQDNLITEIASAGRGGNATVDQGNIKGKVTIEATSVAVTLARGQLSIWPTFPTPSFGDTMVAQIGHGSYSSALAGNGGGGLLVGTGGVGVFAPINLGDGRMEGSGGAGGNATVALGNIVDAGIDITTSADVSVTNLVWEWQNHIGRAQIGSGNIAFATAGFGGVGTTLSNARLHNNQFGYHLDETVTGSASKATVYARAVESIVKADAGVHLEAAPTDGATSAVADGQIGGTFNGGKGGDATVSTGLINNAIELTVGGSVLVTADVGQIIGGTQIYTSLDDHVLATIGHGSYGTSVSGAGGDAALGAGVSNVNVSMNGGAGGISTVDLGDIGRYVAGRTELIDGVDATGAAPIVIDFTNGGLLTVTALNGQGAASTADPLDDSLRVDAAVIGHTAFAYADSTYAKGGNASLAASRIGHADGGAGGSAIARNGSILGSISIGDFVDGEYVDAPSAILVSAVEDQAWNLGRAEARIGHFRQAQARSGLGDLSSALQAVGGLGGNVRDFAISEYDSFDHTTDSYTTTHTWYGVGETAIAGPSNVQPEQPNWYPINQRGTAFGGKGGDATTTLGEIDGDLNVYASGAITVTALVSIPPSNLAAIPLQSIVEAGIGFRDRTKTVAADGGIGGTADTNPNGHSSGEVGTSVLPIALAVDVSGADIKAATDALASMGGDGGNAVTDSGAHIGAINVRADVVAVTSLQTAGALTNGLSVNSQIGHSTYDLLTVAGMGGDDAKRGGDGGNATLIQRGFGGDIAVTADTSIAVTATSNFGLPSSVVDAYIGNRQSAGNNLLIASATGTVNPLYWAGGVYGGAAGTGGNGGSVTVEQLGTVSKTVMAGAATVADASTSDITLRSYGTIDVASTSAAVDLGIATTHVGHDVRLVRAVAAAGSASALAGEAAYVREDGSEKLSAKGGDLTISQGPIDADVTLRGTGAVTASANSIAASSIANTFIGNYQTVEIAGSGAGANIVTSFANSDTTGTDGAHPAPAGSGDGGTVIVSAGALDGRTLIQSDAGDVTVMSNAALGVAADTLVGSQRLITVTSGAGGASGGDGGNIAITRGDIVNDIALVTFRGNTTSVTSAGALGIASTKVGAREYVTATAGDGGAAHDLSGLAGDLGSFVGSTPNDATVIGNPNAVSTDRSLDQARSAIRAMESVVASLEQAAAKAAAVGDTANAATISAQLTAADTALANAKTEINAAGVANSDALPNDAVKAHAVAVAVERIQGYAETVQTAATTVAALPEKLVDPGKGGDVIHAGTSLISSNVGIYATASTAISGFVDPNNLAPVALTSATGAPTQSGTVNVASLAAGAVTSVHIGTERIVSNTSGNGGATVGTPGAISVADTTTGSTVLAGGAVTVTSAPTLGVATLRVGDLVSMTNTAGTANAAPIETGGSVTSTSTIGAAAGKTADILVFAQVGDASITAAPVGGSSMLQIGHGSLSSQNGGAESKLTNSQTIEGKISVVSKGATEISSILAGNLQVGDTINENGNLVSTARGTTPAGSGSTSTQSVDSDIAIAAATGLKVDGTTGTVLIGSSSPAAVIGTTETMNGQPTTWTPGVGVGIGPAFVPILPTTNVGVASGWNGSAPQSQTIGGDITVHVNVVDAETTMPGLMTGVDLEVADGSATGAGDASITGATARIGHSFTPNADDTVQTARGDIWVEVGADLLVQTANIGHDHYYDGLDASKTRLTGLTTIGAAQNTPTFNENTSPDAMKFENAVINSGDKANGGQLRFFIPSRSNLTTVGANVFNDSGASDEVKERSASEGPIFAADGGSPHENGFQPMSTTATYAVTGEANFAFYFATPQPFLYDPWSVRLLHGNMRGGSECDPTGGFFAGEAGWIMGQPGDFAIGYRTVGDGSPLAFDGRGVMAASSSNWVFGGNVAPAGHCRSGGGTGGMASSAGSPAASGGGSSGGGGERRAEAGTATPVATFVAPTWVAVRPEDIVVVPTPAVPRITQTSVIAGINTAVQIKPARLNILSMAASGVAPKNDGGLQ
ncbi:MAG: filamentous hemagglutinin N-terminal domain-containing protein [Siculibacillus sp.]|nr:filamentous hemagglutinin N-terminal domain-containing protein [Siculibacillus sp.]